jgi:hypothetical protein
MFQICVPNQKIQENKIMLLKLFLNAMIKNIKINSIFYIIKNSKSMEPNKRTQKKKSENLHLNVS